LTVRIRREAGSKKISIPNGFVRSIGDSERATRLLSEFRITLKINGRLYFFSEAWNLPIAIKNEWSVRLSFDERPPRASSIETPRKAPLQMAGARLWLAIF
jgi:hypothetical protein